ncbi:hypothetical protein ANN_10360 [Periplaneta americana]|uniref:Reverse transcriptase n=1 Tax=Periplaneta americana TaxID=6978 RepID=A0ABQ8TNW3_PERAM|nr:hypothetical protein ANN_10360 [Periplaneta americana]
MAGLCEGGNEPPSSLKASNQQSEDSTESYPAFARIGLRENPGKNLNQITCPDRDSNPGHLVSRPDALTVTPQAEWEANIQYFNICKRLSQVSDDHLLLVRNLEEEKKTALKRLKIPEANIPPRTIGILLRDDLRKRSFDSWCQLPHKGKGVVIYEEYPRANSWLNTKRNLLSSEYINAIKMCCNLTAVRSVPGRAFSTTRCRQPGCNETETLGHVLGFCRKGELLRNNRHNRVRRSIACLLRNKGWEVHEEVHCISEEDSHRRADIIAINRQQQKAIIIDPTIRMERDLNQAHQVDQEKRAIYEPSREWPRPTSRLLASRPHAEAEVDDHPTRMEVSCG